jgi:SulP family sulfate permease
VGASIFSGIWMILILVVFSALVGRVPMPTLAGVLIVAAVGSLRPYETATILRTGVTAQVALATTFVATLFLPVAAAVGIGVALSLLLQLNREALDLVVVELVPRADGSLEEHPAPARLESERVVVLDAYGSLLYAGARTLLARLPDPTVTHEPVVVLRLRGRTALGATFFAVVPDYAARLAAVGGRLFLSGVSPELLRQMRGAGALDAAAPIRVFEATSELGASSRRAYEEAETWLVDHGEARDERPLGR